jgi:hypothetical protein
VIAQRQVDVVGDKAIGGNHRMLKQTARHIDAEPSVRRIERACVDRAAWAGTESKLDCRGVPNQPGEVGPQEIDRQRTGPVGRRRNVWRDVVARFFLRRDQVPRRLCGGRSVTTPMPAAMVKATALVERSAMLPSRLTPRASRQGLDG